MEEILGAGSFAGGVTAEFLERPPFGPDAEKTAGTGSVKPLKEDPVRLAKPLNDRYRNLVFEGSTFPDDPYRIINIRLNETIRNIYLPAMQKAISGESKGLKLLITAMTHQEGFTTASRSFRTNNPGNVGNTDSGANKVFKTLEEGIKAQAWHIRDIADGIRDSSDKVDSERYFEPVQVKSKPTTMPYEEKIILIEANPK
ncbi:MAG: hypothetical protein U0U70_15200 [Chitinophagaceae bacterium]